MIKAGAFSLLIGCGFLLLEQIYFKNDKILFAAGGILTVIGLFSFFIVVIFQASAEEIAREKKIVDAEERFKEHPKETQAAWELARVKLESYLNYNLKQVRSIYWLTVVVMIFGFALIVYGVWKAFEPSAQLVAPVIAACSGIITNFIGASLLLIYRSTMAQARDYVTVLERINAVGMSVSILERIDNEDARLKNQTIADIAKQLLRLYAQPSGRGF
jgi:hypothetical protein